jgi:glyoxylase-like metal-dependent hydrolase (beta-lactamase superfamily II)
MAASRTAPSTKDGDMVGPVWVLRTPGHTPEHLAFWWPERRIYVAGDAIATYPVFEAGWPAFNLIQRNSGSPYVAYLI